MKVSNNSRLLRPEGLSSVLKVMMLVVVSAFAINTLLVNDNAKAAYDDIPDDFTYLSNEYDQFVSTYRPDDGTGNYTPELQIMLYSPTRSTTLRIQRGDVQIYQNVVNSIYFKPPLQMIILATTTG